MLDLNNILNPDISDGYVKGFEILIEPQLHDPFVDDLTEWIHTARKHKTLSKGLRKELEEMIYDRFGMPVEVVANGGPATFPHVFSDHVLSEYTQDDVEAEAATDPTVAKMRDVQEKLNNLSYTVDLKKAKVYGLPKNLKAILYIGFDTVFKDKSMTDKEIAAVLLHELGHDFTFLYYNNKNIHMSVTLTEQILKTLNNPPETKQEIKSATDRFKQIVEDYKKYMDELGNISEFHQETFKVRDVEIEADSFATRFGLGAELASGLQKLVKPILYYTPKIMLMMLIANSVLLIEILVSAILKGNITFLLASIKGLLIYTTIFIIVFLILLGLFMTVLGYANKDKFTYEKLYDRIARIKREYIKVLRLENMRKEDISYIIGQIDQIETSLKKIFEYPPAKTFVFNNLLGDVNLGKPLDINYIMSRTIDELMNNDLYYLKEKLQLESGN